MKKYTIFFVGIMLGIMLTACGRVASVTDTPGLPFDLLTPPVETAQPDQEMLLLIDSLNASLEMKETEIANLAAEIALRDQEIAAYQADATLNAITPTATLWPTSATTSTPSNVMTVVAKLKLNLRYYKKLNNVGKPIMLIYEPRVQYFEGDAFQVLKSAIQVDGGGRYYQVVGPRGAGLYVRSTDIKLP